MVSGNIKNLDYSVKLRIMKVFKNFIPQGFPRPTHFFTQKQGRVGYYRGLLLVLFFCNTLMLQGQWVTHIDCPCDMYPSISVMENSGKIEHDGLICQGDLVTITANGGHKYQWSTGDTTNVITVNRGGGYGVTISDATGCQVVENVLITEYSRPYIEYEDSFCQGGSTIKVKGTSYKCLWSNGSTKKYLNVTQPGTYSVTITDEHKCVYVESATITNGASSTVDIVAKNSAGITSDHTICQGEKIVLHAIGGFKSYVWNPSNSLSSSTGEFVEAQPTVTTTYMVVATDDNGCTATDQITIIVEDFPTSISTNSNICNGDSTQLIATGGTSYSWSPATGLSDPTISNPKASPSSTTIYTVTIQNLEGCVVTKTVTVIVGVADAATEEDVSICMGESAILSASGGGTYAWSPTSSLNDPSLASPTATPDSSTSYTVVVTDASGCTATLTQTVLVTTISVDIQGARNSCSGDSVTLTAVVATNLATPSLTYAWNALANNATSNTVLLTPSTSGMYVVTVTNDIGCTAVDSVSISTSTISIDAGMDQVLCLGDSLQLSPTYNGATTPNTGVTYSWSPNIGINDTTIFNPIIFPTTATTYVMTATDSSGCMAIDSVSVTVNDLQVDIGDDFMVCRKDSLQLGAFPTLNGATTPDSLVTFTWTPASVFTDPTISNPSIFLDSTASYIVTVTDTFGCIAVDTIMIIVNELLITIDSIPAICEGDSIQLNPTYELNGSTANTTNLVYSWLPTTNIDDATIPNPTVSPSVTDTFIITVVDTLTGCTTIDSAIVIVNATPLVIAETSPGTICPDDTITLMEIGLDPTASIWEWSKSASTTGTFIDPSNSQNPRIENAVNGDTFFVKVTNASGCEAVDTVVVAVHPRPVPDIDVSSRIRNDTIELMTVGLLNSDPNLFIDSVIWMPEDYLTSTTGDTTFIDPNGMIDTIKYIVTIIDNNGCVGMDMEEVEFLSVSSIPEMATLSGRIFTETGKEVENTNIHLTGYTMPPAITGVSGFYEFEAVPMKEHYLVSPNKESHPLNGVSTIDIILISKHILGIQPLNSPYKLIAADVNRSGAITAFDIVELRKIILRTKEDFTNNSSWRFVDADYQFIDPANPFREVFPENYPIKDLKNDMTWLDFIAIKIGDVNGSVIPNGLANAESRSKLNSMTFHTQEEIVEDGETIIYHFNSKEQQPILGYQFTLEFDPTLLEFKQVLPSSKIEEEYFGFSQMHDGIITSSWNKATAVDLSKEPKLFSLAFKRKSKDKESLVINSNKLTAEAYTESGEVLSVQLEDLPLIPEVASDRIHLFQNRPNPFTGMTTIGFSLPEKSTATLRIFDTTGKVIKAYEDTFTKGYNEMIIKSADLTQYGALYYQLATPTQIATKMMIHTH